ncbi:GTPase IMAP family member 9-like isoform X1 [Physella acuta]|uniref:GTPase IMAP family member 9-like isoform X1 n=2 Tax=Physella acuta TaxID=109671 RepID=UPI0027DE43CA|nr:GTPase IMAP family member 9-like isoform X1 [Physella acuta]
MGSSESSPVTTINKDTVNILPNFPGPPVCNICFESVTERIIVERREEMSRANTPWTPRINILLIGKTGNGKSSTANTIVGNRRFPDLSCASLAKQNIDYHIREYKGRRIKVVDGLTICDTKLDKEQSVKQMIEDTQLALAANPEGYHAFLLVLKYGNRFTREEQETVHILKKIFGENFVRDYCILIITGGDVFHAEMKASGIFGYTFIEWCSFQEGAFKDLLDECQHRVMVVDNTCSYKDAGHYVDMLMMFIEELLCNRKYDLSKRFEEIKDTIVIELTNLKTTDESATEEESPMADLLQVSHGTSETKELPRDKILGHNNTVHEILAKQEELSGGFRELAQTLESLQKQVSDESAFSRKCIEEMQLSRQHEEEMKINFETQLKNQKEYYENLIVDMKQKH